MSGVAIRAARQGDLARLDPIDASAAETFARIGQSLADGSPPAPDGHWANVLATGLLLVADDGEAGPVGFLAGELAEDNLYVEAVNVVIARQQQGLGRRLMSAAIDWARQRGLPSVTLTTFRDVAWNAPFYASLGFVELTGGAMPAHLAAHLADEAARGFAGRCAMRLAL